MLIIQSFFNILFFSSGALQIVWGNSSPNTITKDKTFDLECYFAGWPLPTVVNWYKEQQVNNNVTQKLITNGTKGTYQTQERTWKNGKETLRSVLHLPSGTEEQEGFYTCSAKNNIPGWSSSASYMVQMIFECKYNVTSSLSFNKTGSVFYF